ncbi:MULTISPECIES: hypothetical protein [unclassified Rhodococcus (in: high G+C Gram-positive bacteria)]|uniref:hypothetical protein n=1 Tax=unclassified Rhodococcus (in: high G+C Gram-positive bacteria) TaxID=192944 RepID=UPI00233F7376|nr:MULTISPECIES: hypothetical protein [unclassified Rhodococcus (in: high G+C Gram-positive bacteria)]MDC3725652.1 hypothetical protein [Rhodococcus sp. Rp3]WSE23456.1 hypothetical protein U9J23_03855 [Rhodococcus sp. PD04]
MRSFVDLGLFLAAVALGIGSVLPVVGGIRPTEIPLSALRDGFPDGDLAGVAVPGLPLYESLAVPLVVAAVLLLAAALFDSVAVGWAGTLIGVATAAVFWTRLLQTHGEYVELNRSTTLTNQNGTVLLLSGTLVALLCCLIALRRSSTSAASLD